MTFLKKRSNQSWAVVKTLIAKKSFYISFIGIASSGALAQTMMTITPPKNDHPQPPEEEKEIRKYDSIKTAKQACAAFKGHILSFYEAHTHIGQDCKQHPIEDPDELDFVLRTQRYPVVTVNARLYRILPFGKPYRAHHNTKPLTPLECKAWEGQYLTTDGSVVYFVNKCRKRAFSDYNDYEIHNKHNKKLQVVDDFFLVRVKNGSDMPPPNTKELALLFEMGDNPALANNRLTLDPIKEDSEVKLESILKAKPPSKITLCGRVKGKIVTFYSQVAFIDTQCRKRPVIPEGVMEVLAKASEKGWLVDLTANEFESLALSKPITGLEVWKKIQ